MRHEEDGFPEALGDAKWAWQTDVELKFNADKDMLGKVEEGWLTRVLKMKGSNFRRKD